MGFTLGFRQKILQQFAKKKSIRTDLNYMIKFLQYAKMYILIIVDSFIIKTELQ